MSSLFLTLNTFIFQEHKETDLLRYDVQIKDKEDSLLLQQAHSEPSRWKTNRQKMSGMHHDLSAPPWGEGSLNPRCCWRARLHTANSQRKPCRLSQAFRRTGQAPPLQLILLCTPLEYGEGGLNPSWPSLRCCFDHIVFFSLCSGQQRVSSSASSELFPSVLFHMNLRSLKQKGWRDAKRRRVGAAFKSPWGVTGKKNETKNGRITPPPYTYH